MHRYDFFYRQKVTEGEVDAAFDATEEAIWNLTVDNAFIGLVSGGDVTEEGTPAMGVSISALVAYDITGNRIAVPSSTDLSLALDENSASTAVASAGNERWISVFVKFKRLLTDARLDGLGQSVFYDRAESYEFVVVAGAEAAAGASTRPSLRSDHVLLADVLLSYGDASILNAAIDSATRKQYLISSYGGEYYLLSKTYKEAIVSLLAAVNDLHDNALLVDNHGDAQVVSDDHSITFPRVYVTTQAVLQGPTVLSYSGEDLTRYIPEDIWRPATLSDGTAFPAPNERNAWYFTGNGTAAWTSNMNYGLIRIPLDSVLPHKTALSSASVRVTPGLARSSTDRMALSLVQTVGSTQTVISTVYDDGTANEQTITISLSGQTIDKATKRYTLWLKAGSTGVTDHDGALWATVTAGISSFRW